MLRKLLSQLAVGAAFAAVTTTASAIPFAIAGGSGTATGFGLGSTLSITPASGLSGYSFDLDVGGTETFDFLDVNMTGIGGSLGSINTVLNFDSPTITSADGILGGFGAILGFTSFGGLTVLDQPGQISFGDGGLFNVVFHGFEDGCFSWSLSGCASLSGTVKATVKLLESPVVVVPEPGTLTLLGAGLLLIGISRRRRRT